MIKKKAAPRAFISFDFDHNAKNKLYFSGQSVNSRTPFTIQDWSSKTPLPQKTWKETIKQKINKCHFVVVLVGKHMASASGVKQEIKMAKALNVPVFGVYVDGANYLSNLPEGLARSRTINWNWQKISDQIILALTKGKNKTERL